MKPKERIDNFLQKIDWDKLLIRWGIGDKFNPYKVNIIGNLEEITKYWRDNPNQRIGQLLINFGVIPDDLFIWMDEEIDILLEQGLQPEEVLFWGKNYDKNENPLPKTEWILIDNLETDHIQAIFSYFDKNNKKLNKYYKEAFNNVLKKRL